MELSNLAKIFKALANEQRLRVFQHIYNHLKQHQSVEFGQKICHPHEGLSKAFTHACKHTCLAKSTISHHFKELQNSGLIACKRTGQSVTCTINEKALEHIKKFLE